MNRVWALVLVTFVLAASCGGGAPPRGNAGKASATSGPGTASAVPPSEPGSPPAPDEPIPADPVGLAERLTSTTIALRESIGAWTTEGDPSTWPPPEAVQLLALYQQRLYRVLAGDPALADATIALLPASVAAEARSNMTAANALASLAHVTTHPNQIRTRPPEPAGLLLGYYREAERQFGVAWQVLAAVNYIESKFGRVVSASWAGAQGPMQFMPATWAAYGMGGDVQDPRDAIMGAANYLSASGAPADYRRALYAYNPVRAYVDAVLAYAHQMMRDPRTFYAYYNWQVFVLTKHGAVRLTGP